MLQEADLLEIAYGAKSDLPGHGASTSASEPQAKFRNWRRGDGLRRAGRTPAVGGSLTSPERPFAVPFERPHWMPRLSGTAFGPSHELNVIGYHQLTIVVVLPKRWNSVLCGEAGE